MGLFSSRKKNKEDKRINNTDFVQMSVEEALEKLSGSSVAQTPFNIEEENLSFLEKKRRKKEQAKNKKSNNVEGKGINPYQGEIKEENINDVIKGHKSQILELTAQLEETKQEYEAVTSYLSDIQKIEQIPDGQKKPYLDAANKIINFEKERKKYLNIDRKLSEAQFAEMNRLEDDIKRELPKLKDQEHYQQLIKEDLRQLEGEKGVLNYDREQAISKVKFLKQLAIGGFVMILLLFAGLFLLDNAVEADLSLPILMTVFLGVILVAYIIYDTRRCSYKQKMAELKLNRAVSLINKVKLKYVNCTAMLDYSYEKYHTTGHQELMARYQLFLKEREELERLEQNTELLGYYQEELVIELRKHGIDDAEVWGYQAEALLDKKEMVEVRHRLNGRRQKLREHIDLCAKQLDLVRNSLEGIRTRNPEYESEMV
ncbi:hypothetical protein [Lachnoclostridium phytofermentans]|uniref:Uncharacterized protein n=1 Tax=Lachnoclostridium phytofermentans (strain ATCC 700394 / DSM 18823 / ISDg) TaxID=357809 RepID=A9KHI0_LACP7|nr:hypothetical protein [Lachnoclostridium phytofermentans]ABX40847.1 hypothetical protein Cphy_0460 [Lachnoclostridium phytofermentans ISDg]